MDRSLLVVDAQGKSSAFLSQSHRGETPFVSGWKKFHNLIKHTDQLALMARFDGLRASMDLGDDVEIHVEGTYNDRGDIGTNTSGDFIVDAVTVGGVVIPDALHILDGVRDYDSGRFVVAS